jgi:VIT1/CCC1 family predicted Fe2+/Mn2+ transporter
MRSFIRRYLSPADRLGEILFGLIMALGFTGAVRLGQEEAENRALFIGIFGCNLAWAIVDGVMYALTELFERGRRARLVRAVLGAGTEEAALKRIGAELDGPLMALTSPEERRELHRWVLNILRRDPAAPPRLQLDDLLGGAAVALLIVLSTLPIVVPYLVIPSPDLAVRLSNLIALAQLFLVGAWWARVVGGNWLRIACGLTFVGVLLVLVTIALGG